MTDARPLEGLDAELLDGSEEVVGLRVIDGGATEDLDAPCVGQGGCCGVHGCDAEVLRGEVEVGCYQAERGNPPRSYGPFSLRLPLGQRSMGSRAGSASARRTGAPSV